MRRSGILLPISSIPSKYGIGTFSKEAYEFVDFLEAAGQKLWQILPLGPTGYGDSPYQPFSTFAGNPYFIDLEELIQLGCLTKEECEAYDSGDDFEVNYEKIYLSRFEILKKAFRKSDLKNEPDFIEFCTKNEYWLEDYALYMAVKGSFQGKSWLEWKNDIKLRKPEAVSAYQKKYKEEIACYRFQQYFFAKQWKRLKAYANKKGIEIIGDLPIYVALDGADAWSNPQLFQLDENLIPLAVAGCPPDAFSSLGQLWGNPLYTWDYHKSTGYEWWMKRIAYSFELYDIVRIDHFRGFDEYYSIPYGHLTAEHGKWEKGPGYDIFDTMKKKIGNKPVIAEDLGFLTPSVIRLVKKTKYPGMKIIQFAFDSREESDYLPHNYIRNCVVYTGTHDNDTTEHWFQTLNRHDRNFAKRYMNLKGKKPVCPEFIRMVLSSVADTAIIPMQDYLGLGAEARMNTPSTLGNNWRWRMQAGECSAELAVQMKKTAKLYGR